MHPAYSVLFFTTASGAGYGLLVWLALFRMLGLVPTDRWTGFWGLGLALGMITLGLFASTAHLGHPERAWRAMTQWRSSWLSREGIAALATYVPAGLLGIGWVLLESHGVLMGLLALLSALLAVATVWCTGMIYAVLRTIRQWHQLLTAPVYVALALATGAIMLNALAAVMGYGGPVMAVVALLTTVAALALKLLYWRAVDADPGRYTAEAATGLGHLGEVRPLDPPHTQANFVMREMGYRVARKHAVALRMIAVVLLFLVPIAALLVGLLARGTTAVVVGVVAALSAALGVLVERWLFFAEAEHVAMLFYGRERA